MLGIDIQKRGIYVVRAVLITGLFLIYTMTAEAATLLLSPASGEYSSAKTFSVKILVDSKGASVNAVETKLSFDKTILNVQSISKTGSAFSLWTMDPKFSNAAGTIEFGGGSPSPFSGTKTLATIVFKPIAEGVGAVTYKEGLVTAADGKGTDILDNMTGGSYTIAKGTAPVTPPKVTRPTKPTLPAPLEPEITSIPETDPDKWYATTTFNFNWELPYGISGVKLLYDEEEDSSPTVLYEPAITGRTITLPEEGEWYFHVVFRNSGGWGIPVHRPVKVDLTPPGDIGFSARGGELEADLKIDVIDELSGIHHYDIAIDSRNPTTIPVSEVTGGSYTLEFGDSGEYILTVRAYDYAGNFSEATTSVSVEAFVPPPSTTNEETAEKGGVDWGYILSILFAIMATYFYARLKYERREYMEEREHIKKEAGEAQEKLELIFNALRDEVEEQMHVLAQQPNLTDHERDVLQKLKDSLEISEELLDKEIEDVRKLLH